MYKYYLSIACNVVSIFYVHCYAYMMNIIPNTLKVSFRFLLLASMLFSSHFALAQTVHGDSSTHMSDPVEPINRLVWDFNYAVLDNYLYRPVTQAYVDWIPKSGRVGVNNFVLNLEEPSTIVNNLIQLEMKYAGDALLRFTFNSSVGFLGFFDVAALGGVERRRETFSNVLGRWDVPHGPYLMLPIIGPRSTRKLVGNVIDNLYFPISYLTFWQSGLLWGLDGLEVRESLLGQELLVEQSLDSYILVKEVYMQYEAFKFYANDGNMDSFLKQQQIEAQQQTDQDLSDFMDEID